MMQALFSARDSDAKAGSGAGTSVRFLPALVITLWRVSPMGDSHNTRSSLLVRVRDPQDKEAWSQFVELYGPLIYQFARKRGLQDADAADLTQTVLQVLAREMKHLAYDPGRGTFRGWLHGVVRNQLHKFLTGQRRCTRGSGDPCVQQLLDKQPGREDGQTRLWEREYERQLFVGGLPWKVRVPKTWPRRWACVSGPFTWPRAAPSTGSKKKSSRCRATKGSSRRRDHDPPHAMSGAGPPACPPCRRTARE